MRCTAIWPIIALFVLFGCTKNTDVDILILGGDVFSGKKGDVLAQLDVGIVDDRIVFLGDAARAQVEGRTVLNAVGFVVSAGFIDPHTHSLNELLSNDNNSNENYLFQGVTTVFNGNDGDGPVDIAGLAAQLSANGIGTNTALYVGHGSLRQQVMHGENRAPTADELAAMQVLVRDAMHAGALGLSTGLFYAPGSFSQTEEIVALAKAAAEFGGVYDSHLRDESSYNIGLLAAVDEAIAIGKGADIPVHIAHIKALGVDVWGQSSTVIARINTARAEGQAVTADQYPWRASGTHLRNALLPKYVLEGDSEAYLERLNRPELITRIRDEVSENLRRRGGPESLLIVVSDDPSITGRTLEEVADTRGKSAVDVAVDIIRGGSTRVASFNMAPDDITAFMSQEWVMTSSDGTDGHPRKYASFPKKYQSYVRNGDLALTDFLYRSSTLAAKTFGLESRGTIAVGNYADIVVFDPETFAPAADFDHWDTLSTGVVFVLVNGQIAVMESQLTDVRSGRVLRKRLSKER